MKRGFLALLALSLVVPLLVHEQADAASEGLVLRSIQASGKTASHELIEVQNLSSEDIDITGWSIVYSSASGATSTTLIKFTAPDVSTRVVLGGNSIEAFVSNDLAQVITQEKTGLVIFSGGMNHVGGSVKVLDSQKNIIDRIGWGTSVSYDGNAAPALTATTMLQRISGDTDDNMTDFKVITQSEFTEYKYGSIFEQEDRCGNIEDIQEEVPVELVQDNDGNCVVPFVPAKLLISELMPNPSGSDAGREFVELYNDEDFIVSLDKYSLSVGSKKYLFPEGSTIGSREYKVFTDDDLGLTLANTTGVAVALFAENIEIDLTESYSHAPADSSWARIGESWDFTNQPTPLSANKMSLEINDVDSEDPEPIQTPCREGYYRYELTGRCRKIQLETTPAPCKDGQYRSEETGRCRSIAQAAAASTLKPCADDQFRNPQTGRCKKIASTEDIPQPCKEGYVRNPETNRCRKELLATMPQAAFPVEPVREVAGSSAMWWTLGGIIMAAFSYAAWEWRSEVSRILRKAIGVISFGRR